MEIVIAIIAIIVTIVIAVCSSRSTAKQVQKQIDEVKTLASIQLLTSELHLATAMNANEKIALELKDQLDIKREAYDSGITVLDERRDVMERNIKRLEILLQKCEALQKEYQDLQNKINNTKN